MAFLQRLSANLPRPRPRPRSDSASILAGRKITANQVISLLLSFLLLSSVGGVLTAGLVMPAVATTSVITDTSVRLFDDLPEILETGPLSQKSTILAADGTVLATFYHQNRIVVPLEDIAQPMRDAVIAIEDHRFYEHGGVDVLGIIRAAVKTFSGDTQGASTLTQQYVKNALIQEALAGEDEQEIARQIEAATVAEGIEGWQRKLEEAKLAIALEHRMSKDEILEGYLNIAQFGISVYGVEAAAQFYFSKSAADLDYIEAATIAGVTQAPGDWDPTRDPEASEERRNQVLHRMLEVGFLTEEEYQTGIATPIEDILNPGQTKLGCMAANDVYGAGFFCDYVTKIIINSDVYGADRNERARLLYRGGLTITTTLDTKLQAIANSEVKRGIPTTDESGVASAISVVQPGTGQVLAMAQNRTYNSSQDTAAHETSVNYNTDNAYGGSNGFAPGSTFKPFTLAQWLKEGHALGEIIDARLRPFNMRDFRGSCTGFAPGTYRFGNAEGNGGIMSVLDATRNSVNSGYIAMASELDMCGIFQTASDLGIHRPNGEPFDVLPANVIGSQEVAPLTMAAAFAGFAANGRFCEPIAITQVVNAAGEQLPVPSANCRSALSPAVASGVNYALSHVWSGTGAGVGGLPGRPSAGKTGTTSENEYTWFVGYTPQISTAVWVGFPEGMIPVQRITINGRYYRNVYGSSIALPTWKRFMVRAHDGLPVQRFPAAGAAQVTGAQITVPDVSDLTPEEAIRILEQAGFHIEPKTSKDYSPYGEGRVARTVPAAGTTHVKGTVVKLIISRGPEPPPDPEPTEPPDPPPPEPEP